MEPNPARESIWEFNAPKFVDFTAPMVDDDNADAWFDAEEAAILRRTSETNTPKAEMTSPAPAPVEDKEEEMAPMTPELKVAEEARQEKRVPSNLCTDPEEWERKKKAAKAVRKSPRVAVKAEKREQPVGTPQLKRAALKRRSEATPQHNSAVKSARTRRSVPHASVSSVSSVDSGIGMSSQASKAPPKMPKLTMPSTPAFMKRMENKSRAQNTKTMTTEEQEMERIRQMQQQLAEHRKKNQASYKKAMSGARYAPVRSTTNLTKPAEFHFSTDSRVKAHEAPAKQDDGKDFANQLRHHQSPAKPVRRSVTKVQPFHFSDSHKRRSADPQQQEGNGKFKSMAELVNGFASRTPERFRTQPKTKGLSPAAKLRRSPRLTVPKTPQFADIRKRPVSAVSHTEMEEKEVEEIKKYKFKANPVDERIFHNPNLGVKKVEPKPVTETVDFRFETDRRLKAHKSANESQTSQNSQIDNTSSADSDSSRQEDQKIIKAKPIPHAGIPFQPKLNHKTTVPAPFTFEERDRSKMVEKEEKIHKILEEEKKAAEFHAHPLPATPTPLPPKKEKPVTMPETPNLRVKQRGLVKADKWSKQIEEELKQQKTQSTFHAKPCKVAYEQPFVPVKSHKPLTDISEFQLNTDKRSKEREEFEMHRKQKEFERDLVAKQRQDEQEREEKAALSKLRQDLTHKSNPIKHYKAVEVEPSNKPLTEAKTPRFSERISKKYRV